MFALAMHSLGLATSLPPISAAWIAAIIATIAFCIVSPLALAVVLRRRLQVGWRYFWYGALVFLVFQVLTRVPAVQVIQASLTPQLKASPALLWTWLVILALTAGLFEEVGRYVGYRVFFRREEKTWNKAVMYGAGHGGLESLLLVAGLGLITLVNVLVLPTVDLGRLPAEQQTQITTQFAALAAQPAWLPLLGAYERVCAVTFHIAMSVVVLQVFRRGQIRWLWLAILAHAAFDFAAVAATQILPALGVKDVTITALLAEGIVTIGALLGLRAIFALRDRPTSGEAVAEASPAAAPERI